MLSQDKCLPIAYKCLSFTVLFVLERHCVFKMLFIHCLEIVSPGLAYLQPHPRKPELPLSATGTGRQCRGKHGLEASLPSMVSLWAVLWTLAPSPGFQLESSACLALAQ